MKKVKKIIRQFFCFMLLTALCVTSVNLSGIGMTEAHATESDLTSLVGTTMTCTDAGNIKSAVNVKYVDDSTYSMDTLKTYHYFATNKTTHPDAADTYHGWYIFRTPGLTKSQITQYKTLGAEFDIVAEGQTRKSDNTGLGEVIVAISKKDSVTTRASSNFITNAYSSNGAWSATLTSPTTVVTKNATINTSSFSANLDDSTTYYLYFIFYSQSYTNVSALKFKLNKLFADNGLTPAVITTNPSSQVCDVNTVASFSVGASNASSYQWSESTAQNGSYTNILGATSALYQVRATTNNQNHWYRCTVQGDTGTAAKVSSAAQLTLNSARFTTDTTLNTPVTEGDALNMSVVCINQSNLQWQSSIDGVNWTDISGATNNTFSIASVPLTSNGLYYHCKATSIRNSSETVNSSAKNITVNEAKPVFEITGNTSIIEDQNINLSASNVRFCNSYQWYISTVANPTNDTDLSQYTVLTESAGNIIGTKSYALTYNNIPKTLNSYKLRLVATNVTKTEFHDVTLSVAGKEITGMVADYPFEEVEYGSTINCNQIFVTLRYNNGDAFIQKNQTGLTFDDSTTSKTANTLGTMKFIVKMDCNGVIRSSSFNVNVVDKTSPIISSISQKWQDDNIDVSNDNISSDADKKVVLSADVTDNYSSADHLIYQWYKDGTPVSTDKKYVICGTDKGNGQYAVQITDENGNDVLKNFNVYAWDLQNPTLEVKTEPDSISTPFATYRIIKIQASDDCSLADEPYSFDNGASFVSDSSKIVELNGTYHIVVKDRSGRTTSKDCTINDIDRLAPNITGTERQSDNTTVHMTITAEDTPATETSAESALTYGYLKKDEHENYSILWQNTGYFEIEQENNAADANGRMFYVKDQAGNTTSVKLYINSSPSRLKMLEEALNDSLYQNPTNWVNKETGVTLGFDMSQWIPELRNNVYDQFRWSNENDYTYNNETHVTENGTYNVTVYTKTGSGQIDKSATSNDFVVDNIDGTKPDITLSQTDNTITIDATDSQSGISTISILGGTYTNENIIKSIDNDTESNQVSVNVNVEVNDTYTIYVKDKVGNVSEKVITIKSIPDLTSSLITSCVSANPKTWTKGNVTLSVSIPEKYKSYLSSTPYSWDNGKNWGTKESNIVKDNGYYYLDVQNISGTDIQSMSIAVANIDKEEPAIIASQYDSTLMVAAADAGSGIRKIEVTDASGDMTTLYTATKQEVHDANKSMTICGNGNYTVKAVDYVGNTATKTITVTSAPELSNTLITASLSHTPTYYTRGNVTLTAVLDTKYSSILATEPYSWDGGKSWIAQPYTIVEKNGTYTLKIRDFKGNISTTNPYTISNIDKIIPSLGVSKTDTGVLVTLYDKDSGLKSLSYSVNNYAAKTKTYNADVLGVKEKMVLTLNGTYLFTVTDVAGNTNSKQIKLTGLKEDTSNIDDDPDNTVSKNSDNDKDKDSNNNNDSISSNTVIENDKTTPSISVVEKDKTIYVTVEDTESGIDKITLKQGNDEKLLIKAGGSESLTYRYKPDKNGKYTFYVYDKNGNRSEATIEIKDLGNTISDNNITSSKTPWYKNTLKALFIGLSILLLLLLIALLAYWIYKHIHKDEEDEDDEEDDIEENIDESDKDLYEKDCPYEDKEENPESSENTEDTVLW